jgi:hypothetical protein
VGATSNKGITYRERSPLVLPPSNALPTPQPNVTARAPNWPRDPDELERAAAVAAARAPRTDDASRPLTPTELAKGRSKRRAAAEQRPGEMGDPSRVSPTELGYKGGLFGSILRPQKEETAVFTGEPPRDTLTAPPAGYQTPAPNYAYGVGIKAKEQVDPSAQLPPGKY